MKFDNYLEKKNIQKSKSISKEKNEKDISENHRNAALLESTNTKTRATQAQQALSIAIF